jgi:hypothetical protein
MSINLPRSSEGPCGLGRSGGGQVPPVGLNPSVDTPSRDPIDSFGTLVSASQTAPASGPIRPLRSSPSPMPYDTGFETPCAQRMSSASQAASSSARRQGTMSPSPAPSYALIPIAPMSEGGGRQPVYVLGESNPLSFGRRLVQARAVCGGPEDRCSLVEQVSIRQVQRVVGGRQAPRCGRRGQPYPGSP